MNFEREIPSRASTVVCGAGMAGVAFAWHLVRRGRDGVVVVDAGEPLGLTSSQGTEAYRTWWPGMDAAMVRLTSRSVDLLEAIHQASDGAFAMSRRGYVFATGDAERLRGMVSTARQVADFGAGPLRRKEGDYAPSPAEGWRFADGADLVTDPAVVKAAYPFIAPDALGLLHLRRAGWLDSRALGRWLLADLERQGVTVLRDRLVAVEKSASGAVAAVVLEKGGTLPAEHLVLAPGPLLPEAGRLLGLELPVINELHGKAALRDPEGLVPRDAPLMIWNDPVRLSWTEEERQTLADRPDLLRELPLGAHFRPRGDGADAHLLLLWTYAPKAVSKATWPPAFDPYYGEVLLRGVARMIPDLEGYFGRGSQAEISGGYYCKAPDNRPLIGPLPVPGVWVVGALSGFGIMSSQGAGDLLAAHLTGDELPSWAPAFHPARFDDPIYRARLAGWDSRLGEL
ncbi:MAG: FAD-binding oxidoreductase [Acidobacteriota bacterium]